METDTTRERREREKRKSEHVNVKPSTPSAKHESVRDVGEWGRIQSCVKGMDLGSSGYSDRRHAGIEKIRRIKRDRKRGDESTIEARFARTWVSKFRGGD